MVQPEFGGKNYLGRLYFGTSQKQRALGSSSFHAAYSVQFHRGYKNNTDTIILTCTDPIFYQLLRTLALICTAVVTVLIVTLFEFPYGMAKTGNYFQPATFFTSWYLIFLGALIFSVLLSSDFYMLTRRAEAAFIIMAGLILLSKLFENMYTLNPSCLFYWV